MYPKTGELSIKELRSAIPITEAENDDIYDISSKSNNEDPEIALDSNGLIISSSNMEEKENFSPVMNSSVLCQNTLRKGEQYN